MNYGFTLLLVACGGAIGAISRFQITIWFTKWFGTAFPFATLTVNVVGAFLIGLIMAALTHHVIDSPVWRPIVTVGFLGALTTFSTFSLDTLLLINQGEWLKAILNIILNVVVCMIAVSIGYLVIIKNPIT